VETRHTGDNRTEKVFRGRLLAQLLEVQKATLPPSREFEIYIMQSKITSMQQFIPRIQKSLSLGPHLII
jgi:hypothetical protein